MHQFEWVYGRHRSQRQHREYNVSHITVAAHLMAIFRRWYYSAAETGQCRCLHRITWFGFAAAHDRLLCCRRGLESQLRPSLLILPLDLAMTYSTHNIALLVVIALVEVSCTTSAIFGDEPTDATEAAAQRARQEAELEVKYQAWVSRLTQDEQAWERTLQAELGGFYLPIHKREKVAGKSNAWDFVKDDPTLPRVLLIGDSVSRAYTQTVRKELAGIANVHRAPANCGPTATGLRKLDVWLGSGTWDVIHFNFGIHDRSTPIADYAQRLEELVQRLKMSGATVVWASTTPIPDVPDKKFTAASIVDRNKVAAEIMNKHQVLIDDLFLAITPRLSELQNPADVHFAGPGNQFLGQQVAHFLKSQVLRR